MLSPCRGGWGRNHAASLWTTGRTRSPRSLMAFDGSPWRASAISFTPRRSKSSRRSTQSSRLSRPPERVSCRIRSSEEHTSELQSRLHIVCRLLLGKKKHTSELQSRLHLVCRLLLEKKIY